MTVQITDNVGLYLPTYDFATWHTYVNDNFKVIDGLLANALGLTSIKGLWAPVTHYSVGDVVVDGETLDVYECLSSHTSGSGSLQNDIVAHPERWQERIPGLPVFKGTWQPNTLYQQADFVMWGHKYAAVAKRYVSGTNPDAEVSSGKLILIVDLTSSVNTAVAAAAAAQLAAQQAQLAVAGVTSSARVTISETAPTPAVDNQLWFNPINGRLAVRYNDKSSAQWLGVGDAVGTAIGDNELDNGDFQFVDYGTDEVVHTPGTPNIMVSNRWQSVCPGTATHSLRPQLVLGSVSVPRKEAGLLYYGRSIVTIPGATGPAIMQRGLLPHKWLNKHMVFGCWLRCSVDNAIASFRLYLQLNSGLTIANIGNPDLPATDVIGIAIHTGPADTWGYYSVPFQCRGPVNEDDITPDNTTRWMFGLRFTDAATWHYTGMKLEVGGQATAFRVSSDALMRQKLARYRRAGQLRLSGRSTGSTTHRLRVPHGESNLRTASPAVTFTTDAADNVTSVGVGADQRNVYLYFVGPATDLPYDCHVSYVVDGEDLSA